MVQRATKPNKDAPHACRVRASGLSRMGLPPTNCDENKGGVGGSARPGRAREAERIAPGRNCFSTVAPRLESPLGVRALESPLGGESVLPGAEPDVSRVFRGAVT